MIVYEHEGMERDRPVNCCECGKRLVDCVKVRYEEKITDDGLMTTAVVGTHATAFFCVNAQCWRYVSLNYESSWIRKK